MTEKSRQWTGPSEPRSLDELTWMPEPSSLDGST